MLSQYIIKILTAEELVGVERIVAELPGVGKNLHDHLQMRSVFLLKDGTNSLQGIANSLIGRTIMASMQSGPMSMAPSQVNLFWQYTSTCFTSTKVQILTP